jgi:P4 family phage/plasmid primase-like protien
VFNYKPGEHDWIDEDVSQYSPRDLIELLSIRYNIVPDENVLKEGEPSAVYTDFMQRPTVAPQPPPTQEQAEAANQATDLATAINSFAIKPASEEERRMVRRFVLECLKAPWYEEYDKWIRVGWCLHNIEASEEYFTLWKDFSAKSGKSSDTDWAKLRHEWFQGMRKSGDGPRLTQRSLQKWARDDNLELYKQIVADNIHEYIRTEVSPTHYHISLLMKKMYANNYVASVHQRNTEWFKYDEDVNMWKRLNQGLELKAKISCEVAGELDAARSMIRKRISETRKEEERKWLEEKMKELIKVETQLYNNGFTESVMKMASQQFCEEEFTNKLNANPYLFGCRNGVLELRAKCSEPNKHVIFRQGRPEDYVSFLAGVRYPDLDSINYVPYDPSHPIQAEIQEFFRKLFPSPELKAYVLRLLSSTLEGTNKEQCYYTFKGRGSNGKSKIAELMEMTLGDYYTTMSSTVLTRKRPDAGAANPEIMAAKGRRFICMSEPDDKEPINTSRMKQFSGEDMVEARPLYGDQERFRIMGKICMLCNDLPAVNSMDHGTWRRIRVIPFEARFLDKGNPELLLNKPNVYEKDLELLEKLVKWREQFLSLLVHVYDTEYIPLGLNPVPDVVIRESNKYKEKFDVYARFKAERIREPVTAEEQLESRTNPLESKRIRLIIGQWRKENRIEGFTANDALDRMKDEFGEPEAGRFWPTIRMFTNDEDVAEWDKTHVA